MSRRLLVTVRTAAVATLCLAWGCGRDDFANKVQLRYMAWGNPEQMALEEHICDEFNEKILTFMSPSSKYRRLNMA